MFSSLNSEHLPLFAIHITSQERTQNTTLSMRLFALLAAILAFLQTSCDAFIISQKADVQITNNLLGRAMLMVHCKSRDDNLGFHYVAPANY